MTETTPESFNDLETKTTEFAIESDVPVPANREFSRTSKYPFAQLQIGQSFFVPGNVAKTQSIRGSIYGYVKKNPDVRIIAKSIDNGTRVWRVELTEEQKAKAAEAKQVNAELAKGSTKSKAKK